MKAVVQLLRNNGTVADIGCDHGKLSVYLLQNEFAKKVFATDISAPSLDKAKKLAEKEKIKNIEFYVGDGFDALPETPDAAVICGMGGDVIAKIIAHQKAKTKLVLQPMKDSDILFSALNENGFYIEKEKIVREDNRFYEIILAFPGKMEPFDFSLAPLNKIVFDSDAVAFFEHKIHVLQKALKGAEKTKSDRGTARLNELKERISVLERVICNVKSK